MLYSHYNIPQTKIQQEARVLFIIFTKKNIFDIAKALLFCALDKPTNFLYNMKCVNVPWDHE